MPATIKTGTHYVVMTRDKKNFKPIKEVYPELTEGIDAMSKVKHRYRVYYFPTNPQFSEEFKIAYRRYRQSTKASKAD
jgi:hypothetical protein